MIRVFSLYYNINDLFRGVLVSILGTYAIYWLPLEVLVVHMYPQFHYLATEH